MGVPIVSGDKVIGAVSLDSVEKHAFSESDLRLLSTVAASLGVALENARLFDETKRLLAETDERAAELAIVNEIGSALAKQLEFDAIIELIGERISTMFAAHSMFVALYDAVSRQITFPFELQEGKPYHTEPFELGAGLTSIVITSGQPLLLRTLEESIARGRVADGLEAESWLGVPILAGDRVLGVIALESLEHDAYDDGDVRLLSTLASSMGVALENARLFDETKRLLAETDQRAAELALVNEIGSALAKQLDFAAIIELVGERVRSIFDARSIFIAVYDEATNTITWPYDIDEGERFERGTSRPRARHHVDRHPLGTTAPTWHDRGADRGGSHPGRRLGHAILAWRPHPGRSSRDGRHRPREPDSSRLQRGRRATAGDACVEHGRSARERPPLRRDQAPAGRNGPARGGAGAHQRDRLCACATARLRCHRRPGRRPAAGHLRGTLPRHVRGRL